MHTQGEEGPTWNKFWSSFNDQASAVSGGESRTALTQSHMSPTRVMRAGSVLPGDSASHHGDSPCPSGVDQPVSVLLAQHQPISFKFKTPLGRTHRLQALASDGIAKLVTSITGKLGKELDSVGGEPTVEDGSLVSGFCLSYVDDEDDFVAITTDSDLLGLWEAVARKPGTMSHRVNLYVHDPDTQPQRDQELEQKKAADATAASAVDEEAHPRLADYGHGPDSLSSEQAIAGVPNELLLPGAVVALAVVIAGVFTISRLVSRN